MKTFGSIKEGDELYCIKMDDSVILDNNDNQIIQKVKVDRVVRHTDPIRTSIGIGRDFFTVNTNDSLHTEKKKIQDEVCLSFAIYSTSRERAIEEAMTLVYNRLKILESIKRRLAESETALLISDSLLENLDMVEEEEEQSLEEFASMALG